MSERREQGPARGRGHISQHRGSARNPESQDTEPTRRAWGVPGEGAPRPQAPAAVQTAGRATAHRSEPIGEASGHLGGNGKDTQRGAVRGRRMIYDIIRTRPAALATKKGTSGTQVKLTANYFRLLKKPTWSLYQYHVEFAPPIEVASVRKALLRVHREKLGGHIFDGSSLFLTTRLPQDVSELFSSNRSGDKIKISVKFTALVSMAEGRSVQILNIIMRKALEGLRLQLVGRNFFDAIAKIRIPQFNLELWPGYITSIRQHEQDILLCAEISHKVMRTDTVHDILRNCTQNTRGNYQEAFSKAVIGMVVLTDYNNKFYRIDDVDYNTTPQSPFQTKTGQKTFVDYYREKYNIKIQDGRQPMLLSKSKAKDIRAGQSEQIALVPELCRATGITDEMRSNFQLMRAMGEYTRVGPDVRVRKLYEFNNRLAKAPECAAVFREWQMSLDSNLVEIIGRELKNEDIFFGKGSRQPSDQNADWTNGLKSNSLFASTELDRWFLVAPERNMREAQEFVSVMQQAANGMRFRIANPKIIPLPDDRAQTYVSQLENCASKDPQLIMCIAPNNRQDRYAAIKKKCCVDRAIPTQVMLAKTVTPKRGAPVRTLMSIGTKVAIQLSCKLGYAPWMVGIPLSGVMTVGFDVCHDSINRSKSYGALVATMDLKTSSKYFSAVSAHVNGEELSNEISLNIAKALREFRDLHGALPAKIIFYRDGVGEGQLQFVIDHEIANLRAKLNQIYQTAGGKPYGFGFIVVNKRLNSRFFKNSRMNPNPGTVIDDVVTSPESYDFFLVSQCSRQGTVSPTYYNVVTEDLGLPADKIQIFTYKQCHLYYNWSGTTRVPAVCQYAHKLAFLVGQHIHQSPSNLLEKQLYFL